MNEGYVRLRSPANTYKSDLREKWLCKTGDYWVVVNNIGCDTTCGAFAYAHDTSTCPEKIHSSSWRVWGDDHSNKNLTVFRNYDSGCDVKVCGRKELCTEHHGDWFTEVSCECVNGYERNLETLQCEVAKYLQVTVKRQKDITGKVQRFILHKNCIACHFYTVEPYCQEVV